MNSNSLTEANLSRSEVIDMLMREPKIQEGEVSLYSNSCFIYFYPYVKYKGHCNSPPVYMKYFNLILDLQSASYCTCVSCREKCVTLILKYGNMINEEHDTSTGEGRLLRFLKAWSESTVRNFEENFNEIRA